MSAFNEVGPELLSGKSANEMERLLNESPAAYEAVFSDSLYKQFMFKCRAKAEQVQVSNSAVFGFFICHVFWSSVLIVNFLSGRTA
jgi:hypothetical protein